MVVIPMPEQNTNYPTQEEIIAQNAAKGLKTPLLLQVLLHSKSQLIQTLLLLYGFASLMLGVFWLAGFGKDSKNSPPPSDIVSKILIGGGSCATLIGLVGFIASVKYAQKPVSDVGEIETTPNIPVPK